MIGIEVDGQQVSSFLPTNVSLDPLDDFIAGEQGAVAVGLADVTLIAASVFPTRKQWWVRNVSTSGQIITLHPTAPVSLTTGKWLYPGEEMWVFPNWGLALHAIADAAAGSVMLASYRTSL